MITAYYRPQTLDEALKLLAQPNTLPLGGGTLLSRPVADSVQVVDLQLLGLNSLTKKGNELELGATLTLQALLESEHCPEALRSALRLEAPLNIRNAATTAGTLIACDGRSTFATVLLASDSKITITDSQNKEETLSIGEMLPLREQVRSKLITKIVMPTNIKLAFEYVARTPADKPIVCVVLAQWNSGRTRLAVGGYGKTPMLAMDGTEARGIEAAARNAFHESTDEWASAEYRMDVAATLAARSLNQIQA
jgi:CO/xanthine dehydrogenase FAD-binding subunit